jgi:hypothetical protein
MLKIIYRRTSTAKNLLNFALSMVCSQVRNKNAMDFTARPASATKLKRESWLLWSAQALLAPLKAAAELPHSKFSPCFMRI